jgi:hypothetical protein
VPCCQIAHGKESRAWLMTSPALEAAGARADGSVSWNDGESVEHCRGSASVGNDPCCHRARRLHVSLAAHVTVA